MTLTSSKDYFNQIKAKLRTVFEPEIAANYAFILLEEYEQVAKTAILANASIFIQHYDLVMKAVEELLSHKPLQYVLGYTHFCDLKIGVNENVLIPRPETEELVYRIIADYGKENGTTFVDFGTGSGCIPIAIKKNVPSSQVYAVDLSAAALLMASKNAETYRTEIHFVEGNMCSDRFEVALPPMVDVIVSNPPYVLESEKIAMEPNVLNFEPHVALFVPNEDPLLFYRAVLDFASIRLSPKGTIYFEINALKSAEMLDLIATYKFETVEIMKDLNNKDRFVIVRHLKLD